MFVCVCASVCVYVFVFMCLIVSVRQVTWYCWFTMQINFRAFLCTSVNQIFELFFNSEEKGQQGRNFSLQYVQWSLHLISIELYYF